LRIGREQDARLEGLEEEFRSRTRESNATRMAGVEQLGQAHEDDSRATSRTLIRIKRRPLATPPCPDGLVADLIPRCMPRHHDFHSAIRIILREFQE